MAIESKTQLKTYFETADVPTEAQFVNLIDSLITFNDSEISGIANKAVPIGADILLIEDSADGNNKKRVTITQFTSAVGSTDVNAIHDNVAGEISAVTTKATPISGDFILIEDSADSNNKKKATIGSLPAGVDTTALHKATAGEISAMTEKTAPVDADLIVIEDSADSNNKKKVQLTKLYKKEAYQIHISALDTDWAIAQSVAFWPVPFDCTLIDVIVDCGTAPTGSVATFDVNDGKGGSSILSTKITIDATETTSRTAVTPPVISAGTLTAGQQLWADIDGIGTTIAGKDGILTFIIERN